MPAFFVSWWLCVFVSLYLLDSHPIERSIDEDHGNHQEDDGNRSRQRRPLIVRNRNPEIHGQQSEQRRELDDRVQGHRTRVFEWIAYRVADDGCGMQFRSL